MVYNQIVTWTAFAILAMFLKTMRKIKHQNFIIGKNIGSNAVAFFMIQEERKLGSSKLELRNLPHTKLPVSLECRSCFWLLREVLYFLLRYRLRVKIILFCGKYFKALMIQLN